MWPRLEKPTKRKGNETLQNGARHVSFVLFPRFILFYSRVAVEIITAGMGSVGGGHKKEGEGEGEGGRGRATYRRVHHDITATII